jgi:hypothetical protein
MAIPSAFLIGSLRETASRLENGAHYAWGNHGSCNCGNLLQVVSNQTGREILRKAHTGIGEWTELAEDYCGITLLPADQLVAELMAAGLTSSDIHNIEYLEDREVLERLPGGFRWLRRNQREDVILYFRAYADLLEERLDILRAQESLLDMARAGATAMAAE